jgi:hypothetical protein
LGAGDRATQTRPRQRLLGTTQLGKPANQLVRMRRPVPMRMPDHEHGHRHDRHDKRDERRRDEEDDGEDRQWWDDEQRCEDDRGELGDADRCDGCDPGP